MALSDVMAALAAQIQTQLDPHIDGLTVYGKLLLSPTAPCIDIYPSSEGFYERLTMGEAGFMYHLTVRARVSAADHEGQQDLLLSMMDAEANTSLTGAVESDQTVGGLVDSVTVIDGPSGFGTFNDPGSIENRLLGALWRVQVIP